MRSSRALVSAVLVLGAAPVLGAAAIMRSRVVVTVEGASMSPTYESGDRLLVRRRRVGGIRRGQVVVVVRPDLRTGWRDPGRAGGLPGDSPWFVKRAVALGGDPVPAGVAAEATAVLGTTVPPGHLLLIGDGGRSDDSRRWGYCPEDRLVGVVVRKLA